MIEGKLIEDYWVAKTEKRTSRSVLPFVVTSTEKIRITEEELTFFYALTSHQPLAQYTILLTLYGILIKRYFSDAVEEVLVCSPNILKNNEDTPCNPPLLFSLEIGENPTLKEALTSVKEEVREVYGFSDYDTESLKKRIDHKDFSYYTPYGLTYGNQDRKDYPGSLFIMNISTTTDKGLELFVDFSEDFSEAFVARHFLNTFKEWIVHLKEYLSLEVFTIPLITKEERELLLYGFNTAKVEYPEEKTIVDLFEEQVHKTPDSIALEFADTSFTYCALNEQANRFSLWLIDSYGIESEDLIGIQLGRNPEMIIALLGVLKSGGAYVPIDISYPEVRINYIIKDSNCKVVLDDEKMMEFRKCKKRYSRENPPVAAIPSHLSYIIYTSGSTGDPKGVMITHQNVVSFLSWCAREFDNEEFDTILGVTSICFDLSVFEIFYTFTTGKKLRLLQNALTISEYLKSKSKILINTVPSVIKSLLKENIDISNVKALNLAGEALTPSLVEELKRFGLPIRNLYGPSEDTTYSTVFHVEEGARISIGKPIDNTRIYITNNYQHLVPVGVVGEICIAGNGLSRGYLNKPELTSKKFVPDPFHKGERIYITGDLGRWLPDGNIEFIGRKDDQVKIRGYRIELGEIETALQKHKEIEEAVVVAHEDSLGEKKLIAYLVSKTELNTTDLRGNLKAQVPEYAIPSVFIRIDSLPLTPNGKIDKKSLPSVDKENMRTGEVYITPTTAIQKELAGIWGAILGHNKIGIHNNFFELGGHSLMVSRVINDMHSQLGQSVTFQEFFSHPTIGEISSRLSDSAYMEIPVSPELPSYPLTPSQYRLWMLSQLEGGNASYTMPGVYLFEGYLDRAALEKSFWDLTFRHQSLRTVFRENEKGEVRQYIHPATTKTFVIRYSDIQHKHAIEARVDERVKKAVALPFSLQTGPLLRVEMLEIAKNKHVFIYTMHHIISDGWSMGVLIKELLQHYNGYVTEAPVNLPSLRIQYKDYTLWYKAQLQGEQLQDHKDYWKEQFSEGIPKLKLPLHGTRPPVFSYHGDAVTFFIDAEKSRALHQLAVAHHGTLFISLLFLVKLLLHKYTGQEHIMVGSSYSGRDHKDLESQIGLYINNLPLLTRIAPGDPLKEVYLRVRNSVINTQQHSHYPLEMLIDDIGYKMDRSMPGLFNVLVDYRNEIPFEEKIEGLKVTSKPPKTDHSIFDLSYEFDVTDSGIRVTMIYNTDIFRATEIALLEHRFLRLLEQILEEDAFGKSISEIVLSSNIIETITKNASVMNISLEEGF